MKTWTVTFSIDVEATDEHGARAIAESLIANEDDDVSVTVEEAKA